MDKIAFFVAHYSIGNSPSILNLLDLLSERFAVDLYLRAVALNEAKVLKKENVRVISLDGKSLIRSIRLRLKRRPSSYRRHIVIDPHGFVLCKELFPDARPLYYSLELYMSYDHFGLAYPDDVKRIERENIKNIRGLMIQSDEKERLFREDYHLPESIPSFILPVTYEGDAEGGKDSFLQEKFGLPPSCRLALNLGSIAAWHSCIEIALQFSKLKDWALIFQGYPNRPYLEELKEAVRKNGTNNVIISDELYEDIALVDRTIKSCHVGIAWYNDISIGFRTVGKSSGKIAAYLKFGLPVISKAYPSTLDAIEKKGCGVCVDAVEEMGGAIGRIEENYAAYSRNALAEYNAVYRFENYRESLMDYILS